MTFEQQLVRQAIQGSRQAFDTLVEQHYVHVYRFVKRHAANADDAFDLTQNTFVKAYTRISQLDNPDRFEAWMRQIALNECRMSWRGNGANELSLEALEQSATSAIDSELGLVTPSVEESVINDDAWRSVLNAIDSLPVRDREIAHAFFIEEQPYAQIETEQGVSHGALGMRIHRIRKHLARKLRLALLAILAFPRESHAEQTGGTKMTLGAKTCTWCVLLSVSAILWFGLNSFDQGRASADDPERPQVGADKEKCRNNLKKLGVAMMSYAQKNDDQLPTSEKWCDAIKPHIAAGENMIHCPTAGDKSYGYAMNENLSGKRLSEIQDRATTVLLYETTDLRRNAVGSGKDDVASRHDDGTVYLFVDGHTRFVSER